MYRYYRRKAVLLFSISKRMRAAWDSIKYYSLGLWRSLDEHHIFLFGGGLAFSILLCIIPFILILFWALGNFLSSSTVAVQVNTFIDTMIPYEDVSAFVKAVLTKRIREVIAFKNYAGIIGLLGLVFTASGFSTSIRTILNDIFGTREDVNFFLGKLRDLVLILAAVIMLFVSSLVLPMIDALRGLSNEMISTLAEWSINVSFLKHKAFEKLFTLGFSFVMMLFLFSMIYHFVPTRKIRKRAVFIGAVWAALLWEAAKQGFGYYLYHMATYNKIYGAYALIVIVAFWLYYSATVFVFGAVIGRLYHDRIDILKSQEVEVEQLKIDI